MASPRQPSGGSSVVSYGRTPEPGWVWGYRPDADHRYSRLARQMKAEAHGLISIVCYPDGPKKPVIWFRTERHLALCVADDDEAMPIRLQQLIRWYLLQFFHDVAGAGIAPELEGFASWIAARSTESIFVPASPTALECLRGGMENDAQ
jgi:hypothetical protein